MLSILKKRWKTGVITPHGRALGPVVPAAARGRLVQAQGEVALAAGEACPTGALAAEGRSMALDHGRCILCGNCLQPSGGALRFSPESLPAFAQREDCRAWAPPGAATEGKAGGSLQIRLVDAGSCNACEQELAALSGPAYDFQRFGLDVVASPRHADVLLVTGPMTRMMREALGRTWEAVPAPKVVLAAGTCAVSGGIFRSSYATLDGLEEWAGGPIIWLPGCPPRPQAILQALLACREKLRES